MSHVFRLYKGNNTITDWQNSVAYGHKAIEEIQDPDGASAHKEITSIPSPFARIDLVKTAFDFTVKQKELDGHTIFHKMVSDTLDIAQIFFNYPILKDKVKIIVWDARQQLEMELLQSNIPEHQIVGQTLAMFMNQDKSTYNFSNNQRFFLLQYIGKYRKSQMDIIGSTSPSTLFFSSANDLSYLSNDIQFGQDKVFDEDYAPLNKRDEDFIVYMFTYRKFYPQFSKVFKEVDEYMNFVYQKLSRETRDKIDNFAKGDIDSYPELTISTVVTTDKVEINGIPFHHMAETPINSGFEIKSTLPINEKPLVLPVQSGSLYKDIYYIRDIWGVENKAPFTDTVPIQQRRLPNEGRIYPYLTIGDFLEDSIIRIPDENINQEYFFNGNLKVKNENYLLPLKDLFFKYFTTKDLMQKINGKPMIELQQNAGGIKVSLRIPIQHGRHIEYERIYFNDTIPKIENNIGGIIDKDFIFALLSNTQGVDEKKSYYRLIIGPKFDQNDQYQLFCYENQKHLKMLPPIIRNENFKTYIKYQTYILEQKNFTHCRIKCRSGESGIILPILDKVGGFEQYTFAIDFGTTNTHIEYSVNNSPCRAFEMSEKDTQLKFFSNEYENDWKFPILYDFISDKIGNDQEAHFPTRSVLNEGKDTDWKKSIYALGNANIPFYYDKRTGYNYNKITSDLKWSNDRFFQEKIRCYIESLFMILQNKVLLNNGDLKQTKIVWFYPISMTMNRYNSFKTVWEAAYQKYFGGDIKNVIPMTESVAPYEYYKKTIASVNNIATIDIGGGTTDIVFATDGEVKNITSFHFAANSIFGDSFTKGSNEKNGLILQLGEEIKDVLKANDLIDLLNIYEEHMQNSNSNDIISYFFSLKENRFIINKKLENQLDFNKMLQNEDSQKIVFLLFYSALIYHLAHIMKAKRIEMPRHIAFSGNGSKIISILSSDEETLERLTKIIFEKIYGHKYPEDGLTILPIGDQPKEKTCKGGILSDKPQSYLDIEDKKIVLKSVDNSSFITNEKYETINDEYINQIAVHLKDFIRFILDLNENYSFKHNFGITVQSLEIAQKVCYKDIIPFIKKGLELKKKEVSPSDIIEETLFFYPITGILNELISEIYKKTKNK